MQKLDIDYDHELVLMHLALRMSCAYRPLPLFLSLSLNSFLHAPHEMTLSLGFDTFSWGRGAN